MTSDCRWSSPTPTSTSRSGWWRWTARPGRCVPESVVNFPVRLLDRRREPIVDDIRQDRYTLTHRIFEVAAAGDAHEVGRGTGVWLTLSEADPEALTDAFPKLRRTLGTPRLGWRRRARLSLPALLPRRLRGGS